MDEQLRRFRDLILSADPDARHYETLTPGNYTRWAEYGRRSICANDRIEAYTLLIQVDRFTKLEYDPMVSAITEALDQDEVAQVYLCDYERDTGYIHHIWQCEVG